MDSRCGLIDFWQVYDGAYEEIAGEALCAVADHPEIGPFVRSLSADDVRAQSDAARAMIGRAIGGDWQPYEDHLRSEGTRYAAAGLSFSGWHRLIRSFTAFLVPRMARSYAGAPERLASALGGMHEFLDRVTAIIGDAYVATKERVIAEQEAQVSTRFRELSNALSRRASELETVNTELESFCYAVSHDLRGPLRALDGFSQAVLKSAVRKLDDRERDYLQRIRGASQRMGRLIDDLLNLSRLTRTDIQFQTVDLSGIVLRIASELRESQPERSVLFEVHPDVRVEADPRLMEIMLQNLLGNAWKFTVKRAESRIEFGRSPAAPDAYFVRDNGAGFDMAYSDKLFAAFQRLHSPHEFEGTGIGLATVRRIVTRHGGRVWAEGEVERGATFYFTLATGGSA